jgi:hypothetical protein
MLRRVRQLERYRVLTRDGKRRRCRDFLFDDLDWTVRHVVTDRRGWGKDRERAVPVHVLGKPRGDLARLPINLTEHEIEECPPPDRNDARLQARTAEAELHSRLQRSGGDGRPLRRLQMGRIGLGAHPAETKSAHPDQAGQLRSLRALAGYRIQATDGHVGRTHDFVIDELSWQVRFLVVKMGVWPLARQVLVATEWILAINDGEARVHLDLRKEAMKNGPSWDQHTPVTPAVEAQLYDYYGRG